MSDTYQGDDNLDPATDDPDLPLDAADDELPPDEGEDAGQDDDRGDDLPPDEDEPAPRRRSNDTIRGLRARLQDEQQQRAADREAIRNEVLSELRRSAPAPDPAAEDARFQASIRDLPFDEQLVRVRDRERQVFGQQLTGVRMEVQQIADRTAFQAIQGYDPIAKRFAAEVERRASGFEKQGLFVGRELILNQVAGEDARNRGSRVRDRDQRNGARRIADNRGQGAARRGDVAGGQRADQNSIEAIEGRLRGVMLKDI